MELNDDLDVDGLVAGLVVSSVLCLCCTVCCVRAQRGDRDPRATAPQRRRLLTQDVIDKFRAYSAKLAESLVERSYYRINRRGMALYVQEHFPANVARGLEDRDGLLVLPGGESEARDNLKGVVCFVHGVHDTIQLLATNTMRRLASGGYAVFCLSIEGHGTSDGLQGLLTDMQGETVEDLREYHASVRERFPGKPAFLYGESMGGALALFVERRDGPGTWTGCVFSAPMVKIADHLRPPECVIPPLLKLSNYFPTVKAVPGASKELINHVFRNPEILQLVKDNPIFYEGNFRLATGKELLFISNACEATLRDVSVPFFVLHGGADVVTDPEISKALYDRASSTDKSIRIYDGMWHALTSGESSEAMDMVWTDIFEWLDQRSEAGTAAPAAAGGAAATQSETSAAEGADVSVTVQ